MNDPRNKAFTKKLLVLWFVWPLLLGVAGLLWGGFAPPFAIEEPIWAVPAITSGVGLVAGSFVAGIATVVAYRRIYGR